MPLFGDAHFSQPPLTTRCGAQSRRTCAAAC
jgi:hypothetical protein